MASPAPAPLPSSRSPALLVDERGDHADVREVLPDEFLVVELDVVLVLETADELLDGQRVEVPLGEGVVVGVSGFGRDLVDEAADSFCGLHVRGSAPARRSTHDRTPSWIAD